MRAKIRGVFAIGRRLTIVAAITIAAAVLLRPSTANAVQYVKICTLYSTAFFYLPGTDFCVDLATDDAKVPTAFGTWRWRLPNNPRTWVETPKDACQGGQLVKFGDITGSGLIMNSYSRYETTTHYPLKLKRGQYIASVLYKGGGLTFIPLGFMVSDLPDSCSSGDTTFVTDATDSNCTAGDTPVGGGDAACVVQCVAGAWQYIGQEQGFGGLGNFCMYYYYNDPITGDVYTPLGCGATGSQQGPPATSVFTPDTPIPPATVNQVYILGATSDLQRQALASFDISGTLSVWLCLQTASGYGPGHPPPPFP